MNRHFLKFAFCIACNFAMLSLNSNAQTNIPGGNVSGTWTVAGSPYLIQASIMIPNDSTLTIEPGVTVNFQGTYKLLVFGQLLAIGTITNNITFTAADTTNGWKGIRFDGTLATNDTSKIIYCKLTYGNATGVYPDGYGGGFFFSNFSNAIISYCNISHCKSVSGGGIYLDKSSPIISYNTISNNYTLGLYSNSGGGGIYCNQSNPTISHNIISNNITQWGGNFNGGGGIYCSASSPQISYNIISNNFSYASGIFDGGGGIFCMQSYPDITYNIISNNTVYGGGSNNGGGGIIATYGSIPTITNNTISDNTAYSGGGILLINNYPTNIITFFNNIITNNSSNIGGGICDASGMPTLINNTIANNSSDNGGALFCSGGSNPTFYNSILWGNTATTSGSQVYFDDQSSANATNFYYSDVMGGTTAFGLNFNIYLGTYQNNINSAPVFVAPSAGSGTGYDGVNADWSLQNTSPCINAGDPSGTYPATDIAGNPRVYGGTIDIGAYEYQGPVSVTSFSFQTEFVVYPNPTKGKFIIQMINDKSIEGNSGSDSHRIEIYNVLGEIIYSENFYNKQIIYNIDISSTPNGIYYIKIYNKEKIIILNH